MADVFLGHYAVFMDVVHGCCSFKNNVIVTQRWGAEPESNSTRRWNPGNTE